jgi:hypothetical protein
VTEGAGNADAGETIAIVDLSDDADHSVEP